MRSSIVVALGDRQFELRPFTLAQIEALDGVFAGGSEIITGAISAALARDHGSIDFDEVETTPQELAGAMEAILRHGGMDRRQKPARLSQGRAEPTNWSFVRGRLITSAGVSINEVDNLEWWRVVELFDFWREQPPMRDLVDVIARVLGYKPPKKFQPPTPANSDDPSGLGALISMFPDGNVPASFFGLDRNVG